MATPIHSKYARPPQRQAAEATDDSPLYYLANDPRSGATPLYSVFVLGSGVEKRLSSGSYLADAITIVDALRAATQQNQPAVKTKPIGAHRPVKDDPQA